MPVVIHHGRLTAPADIPWPGSNSATYTESRPRVERNADDLFRGRHHARAEREPVRGQGRVGEAGAKLSPQAGIAAEAPLGDIAIEQGSDRPRHRARRKARQHPCAHPQIEGIAERHQTDLLYAGRGLGEGVDRRRDRVRVRPAVHARTDQREGHTPRTTLVGDFECAPIAGLEECAVALARVVVRTHGVDHPFRGQITGRRPAGVARREAIGKPRDAVAQQRGPGRAVNRAVHAAATAHAVVRRVDDRVDILLRDVSADDREGDHPASLADAGDICTGLPGRARPTARA